MVTPANENLLAIVPKPTQGPEQQIGSFKARLGQAYKAVAKANGKSHAANTQRCDRRAKLRSYKVGDYVCLYKPARKAGLSRSFIFSLQVTAKLSDLNYEFLGHNDRKLIFHINRLKPCHGAANMKSNPRPKWPRKMRARGGKMSSAKQEIVVAPPVILSYPLAGDNSPDRDSLPAASSLIAPPRPVSSPPSAGYKENEERFDSTYSPQYPSKPSQSDYGSKHSPRHALTDMKHLLRIGATSDSVYITSITTQPCYSVESIT
jgi:hypothetical protein